MRNIIIPLILSGAVIIQGCTVWQRESHLEEKNIGECPSTQLKYWIRMLPGDSLSSASNWEKCLAIYERRMPSVFAQDGIPVFVELESAFQYSSSVGFDVFYNLLAVCTVCVVPMRVQDHQMRYRVHASLNERQRGAKTFTVTSSIRGWCGLLAPIWPMPDVVDQRFVHSRADGGTCREEFDKVFGSGDGTAYMYELFNGEADAIVHGVACELQRFEDEQRNAKRSRQIGD